MNRIGLLLIVWIIPGFVFGQANQLKNKTQGSITTQDSIHFSIIQILPDSFPTVSIILRTQNRNGYPIWELNKKDFKVFEDSQEMPVTALNPISKNKPIHIAIVLDHSGSMLEDPAQLYDAKGNDLFSYDTITEKVIWPKGYVSPMDNSKITTKEFSDSFNSKKDLISIIGFSSQVDNVLPLTNNRVKIDSVINSMSADSLTALYDGMLAGLKQLVDVNAVNVLVTLTDGQNNKSVAKWHDVTAFARKSNVPIYIIGLGRVNRDTLQMIADETNGQFIYTETSQTFHDIYSKISKDIQAFYDLNYQSTNLKSIVSRRRVIIDFLPEDKDSIATDFQLPEDVKDYLDSRQKRLNYLIGGSVITVLTIPMGILIYRRRRKRDKQD
jgi:Ca-activated chloride channel family protein